MNEPTKRPKIQHADDLGLKAYELQRRVTALCCAVRAAPHGRHEFERELVRQSLSAVQFWLEIVEQQIVENSGAPEGQQ